MAEFSSVSAPSPPLDNPSGFLSALLGNRDLKSGSAAVTLWILQHFSECFVSCVLESSKKTYFKFMILHLQYPKKDTQ